MSRRFPGSRAVALRLALPLAALLGVADAARSQDAGDSEPPRPNLLLLMSDDQGWGDVGFRGHPRLETPHLDAMAEGGLILERFYSAAPVCSPTRGSVLTGKHPMRLGIPGANTGHLPHAERTLAELASDAGYATGFFGKWHLGTLTTDRLDSNRGGRDAQRAHYTTPAEHGFHTWFATEAKVPTWDPMVHPASGESYGTAYWSGDVEPVADNLEGDDSRVIVDRVAPFLRGAVERERPFLAVVWFHAPHLPVVGGAEYLERYADVEDPEERAYYACLSALDDQVGRLRSLLRELEVADRTLVWYGSDNGPEGRAGQAPGDTGGLRGRKRDLWEGGVRVPGIVEWPARIAPGSTSDAACVTSDLLPTLAPLMGVSTPAGLDGLDLGEVLRGRPYQRSRGIGFWAGGRRAWTEQRYKLISPGGDRAWELYDLTLDPAESRDLAAEQPERVAELAARFEAWQASID